MVYSLVADWRDAAVREVGALMAPRVLGLAATQVDFYFIAIFFASRLEVGAISAVSFAALIVMAPLGIVGMAISTAAFPTLAEHAASDWRRLAPTLAGALRLILYLSLPMGVGLMLLSKPLTVVLLQHGAFDVTSSHLTSQALLFYAAGLFADSGIEILSRGFYVTGDTRTPVALAVGSMLLNLGLAAALVGPLEVRGLAMSQSLANTVEFTLLFILIGSRIHGLVTVELMTALGRMLLGTALMAAAVGICIVALDQGLGLDFDRGGPALLMLLLGSAAGAVTYLAATLALGLPEPRQLIGRLRRRRTASA
jgi:putative peptidoglycan lipid II flippase